MLQNIHSMPERWGGINSLIGNWLGERQELIARYVGLTEIASQHAPDPAMQEQLDAFCEVLLDYVSAGHFEVYEQLAWEAEMLDEEQRRLATATMARITATTSLALDFNDKFQQAPCLSLLDELPRALSSLGQMLETRFELEDLLIQSLHEVHRPTLTV